MQVITLRYNYKSDLSYITGDANGSLFTQPLDFPRLALVDRRGLSVAPDVIPSAVIQAQYEIAYVASTEIIAGRSISYNANPIGTQGVVIENTLEGLTQKYSDKVFSGAVATSYLSEDFFEYIDLLLKPFTIGSGRFSVCNTAIV
jgi:hypothetical protein